MSALEDRISRVHLAVFRPVNYGYAYQLVTEESVSNTLILKDEESLGSWQTHRVEMPIWVRSGDVLGFYYDSRHLNRSDHVILMRKTYDSSALKFQMDASSFRMHGNVHPYVRVSVKIVILFSATMVPTSNSNAKMASNDGGYSGQPG